MICSIDQIILEAEATKAESVDERGLSKRGRTFIITGRPGRMANRLVLFAHFIGFAEEYGDRIINPAFHTYADLFEKTRSDIFCQYPAARRASIMDSLPGVSALVKSTRAFYHASRFACGLQEKFGMFGRKVAVLHSLPGKPITLLDGPEAQSQIGSARIILVNGWKLRAPECVRQHAAKIRQHFRPIAQIEQDVRRLTERVRKNSEVVIGVHIRHGDYRRWKQGKYFFEAARYAEWMRELVKQFEGTKVTFLVCSDEPRSAEEFRGLPVAFGVNTPVGDLCALANCDYIFGPPSTYSQWASFYGEVPLFHVSDSNLRIDRAKFRVSWLED